MAKGLPEKIVMPDGEVYVLSVALVVTKSLQKPKLISIIGKNETVELAGGEEFVTLYLPESMAKV